MARPRRTIEHSKHSVRIMVTPSELANIKTLVKITRVTMADLVREAIKILDQKVREQPELFKKQHNEKTKTQGDSSLPKRGRGRPRKAVATIQPDNTINS